MILAASSPSRKVAAVATQVVASEIHSGEKSRGVSILSLL
jgi:hypothetical protein